MNPTFTKTFKIRRFRAKYKKFRCKLKILFAKTFAKTKRKEKLSRCKSKNEGARTYSELVAKLKPKPLSGVKLKYELLPIPH